ncbi:glycosyltransferase [Streptomyces roseoverticillatus]|uniref:glycosyltransferase n=1 Tax=Streptomyces roseoverticillatus TaxID=66429 RepID=UPI00069407FF|nr:glycosyltransferase [Streptomyces roseoverticillatus]
MPTILMASLAASGHVNPFGPVAAELTGRGHRVIWYTGTAYADRVARTGAQYAAPEAGGFTDLDRLTDEHPEFLALPPDARGAWFVENVFVRPVPGQYLDLRDLMTRHRADVLLADSTLAAASLVHELDHRLWATLSVAPLAVPDAWVPPFGKGWPPGGQPWRRARRWYAETTERRRFPGPLRRMNAIRRTLGVPPVRNSPFDANLTPYLYAQATVPEFEYPRRRLPGQVNFIGPLLPAPPPPGPLPAWWPELAEDRPAVLVTQGTGARDLGELVVPTVRALAGSDITVVVTTGGASHEALRPEVLPPNVRVEPFLPYEKLMPRLDAMVTNGGYGTVQLALAHGVPVVAAGRTEDKPEVCARVAWSGTGIDLRQQRPPVPALAKAVHTVLTDPRYRRAASAMSTAFAARRAPRELAVLLEELIATRRPVLAPAPS